MTKTGKWWFSSRLISAVVAAVLCLGAAVVQVADLYWLRNRGEVVVATVVAELHSRRHDEIKVNYLTRAGQPVTAKTSNYHYAVVGQTIEVRYDREKPHRMQAADYTLSYTHPLTVYGGAGAVLVLIALAEVYFRRRRKPSGPTPEPWDLAGRPSIRE